MNPYILLALGVAWVLSVCASGYLGYDYRDGKVAQEIVKAQADAIEEHNKDAAIDMEAAAEVAAKDAAARTRTAMLRGQANDATRNKPSPTVCNLDTERVRVLIVAIKEANGDNKDATGRVRDATGQVNRTIGK